MPSEEIPYGVDWPERKLRTGHPDQGGSADVGAITAARDLLLGE